MTFAKCSGFFTPPPFGTDLYYKIHATSLSTSSSMTPFPLCCGHHILMPPILCSLLSNPCQDCGRKNTGPPTLNSRTYLESSKLIYSFGKHKQGANEQFPIYFPFLRTEVHMIFLLEVI